MGPGAGDYSQIMTYLERQQQRIAVLEAENARLRQQLDDLRRGVGVCVQIEGNMLPLVARSSAAAQAGQPGAQSGGWPAPQPMAPQPMAPQPMAPQPMAPQPMAPQPMAPQPMAQPAPPPQFTPPASPAFHATPPFQPANVAPPTPAPPAAPYGPGAPVTRAQATGGLQPQQAGGGNGFPGEGWLTGPTPVVRLAPIGEQARAAQTPRPLTHSQEMTPTWLREESASAPPAQPQRAPATSASYNAPYADQMGMPAPASQWQGPRARANAQPLRSQPPLPESAYTPVTPQQRQSVAPDQPMRTLASITGTQSAVPAPQPPQPGWRVPNARPSHDDSFALG